MLHPVKSDHVGAGKYFPDFECICVCNNWLHNFRIWEYTPRKGCHERINSADLGSIAIEPVHDNTVVVFKHRLKLRGKLRRAKELGV
jgi:hypothetical protein